MPYISVKTNVSVSNDISLNIKKKLGELISLIPGKSEAWLMCSVEGDISMSFQGSEEACSMVEVKLLGGASRNDCNKLCGAITTLLSDSLSIPKGRIYVKFEGCELWGFNGNLF